MRGWDQVGGSFAFILFLCPFVYVLLFTGFRINGFNEISRMINHRYQETLAYLYSLLPMYQREGNAAFKKGLENINALCWDVGLPQWKFNAIHVAGTNGKGSVSAMLASILKEAGYKVGLYTSPHLLEFTERIRIDGREMEKEAVVEFVDAYRRSIERIKPSFFELTVAMAFDYFGEQEVDIAIIEVGLGGRLDSTNIIRPELSVITNISYDHMDMLGDTLGEIAGEKAGIIKRFTPALIGERHSETAPVFRAKADEMEAPLDYAEDRFLPVFREVHPDFQRLTYFNAKEEVEETYDLYLHGKYQEYNLRTTLAAIQLLGEDIWEIEETDIAAGLKNIKINSGLRGRMELLHHSPKIWCDTGHNAAGIAAVMEQLEAMPHQKLHIVLGMVKEKSHDKMLALLPKDALYYYVKPELARGLPAHTLQIMAENHDLEGEVFDSVLEGVQIAIGRASATEDLIFVGGSTFVVADLLREWRAVVGS